MILFLLLLLLLLFDTNWIIIDTEIEFYLILFLMLFILLFLNFSFFLFLLFQLIFCIIRWLVRFYKAGPRYFPKSLTNIIFWPAFGKLQCISWILVSFLFLFKNRNRNISIDSWNSIYYTKLHMCYMAPIFCQHVDQLSHYWKYSLLSCIRPILCQLWAFELSL